jgi:hypothetical protein
VTVDRLDVETGDGAVAQLGERLVRNEEVRGSIPLSSTSAGRTCLILKAEFKCCFAAHILAHTKTGYASKAG